MLALQGASFYWLFRTHTNILTFTPCVGDPAAELALAPGWRVAGWGNLSQAEGPALPLLWVLQSNETQQVVLMVRSTLSNFEWALDFRFNQVRGGAGRRRSRAGLFRPVLCFAAGWGAPLRSRVRLAFQSTGWAGGQPAGRLVARWGCTLRLRG